MTFNKEFLRKLKQILTTGSNSYPMTKYSVAGLLTFKQLQINDKHVIFDAIRNDSHKNGDPLLVKQLWKENINDSNLRF